METYKPSSVLLSTIAEEEAILVQTSTAENYFTAVRSLQRFNGQWKLRIEDISIPLIDDYQRWLRDRGLTANTSSCYIRSLRSLYNKAIYRHKCQRKDNPFIHAFTGNTRTEKRSVGREELCILKEMKLPEKSFAGLTRDIFLFSFYAMGMAFVDIAYLRRLNIRGNYLVYYRRKTGQQIKVKLEPYMISILEKYARPNSEFLFPIITSYDREVARRQYHAALTYYNIMLKVIARKAGIKARLTSYVSRHTWASMAFETNVDLNVISQSMGHTDTKTTRIYIREINDDIVASENNKMLRKVFSTEEDLRNRLDESDY
ncbi:MAG: site-specific integrase [Prevotella sp.]|nr:site-specific integrase [Prevotella sp.]